MPTVQNNQSGDDDGRVIYCLLFSDYSTSLRSCGGDVSDEGRLGVG